MSGQQVSGIVHPHDHDVLSGRGNFVNYHAGNEHFRALVRTHKVAYVACPKSQKGKFSRMILEEIRCRNPPGRFLKQDLKTKLWYDIGEKKALDKTRQALREGAPVIMKELSGDGDGDVDDDGDEDSGGDDQIKPEASQPAGAQQVSVANINHSTAVVGFFQDFDNFNSENSISVRNTLSSSALHLAQPMGGPGQTPQILVTGQMPEPQRGVASHVSMPFGGMTFEQSQDQFRMVNRALSAPATGLGIPALTSNMYGMAQFNNIDLLQAKMTSLYHDQLDPTPIRSSYATLADCNSGQYASVPPPRRVPVKGFVRESMKREASERSIHFDSILDGSDHKPRFNGSSTHLSVMSLSIGDMNASEALQTTELTKDQEPVGPQFSSNSSRFNERKNLSKRSYLRRQGSGDCTGSLRNVMEMSVATWGDREDFNESLAPMNESQADMSFSNVFDETDRELYVDQTR